MSVATTSKQDLIHFILRSEEKYASVNKLYSSLVHLCHTALSFFMSIGGFIFHPALHLPRRFTDWLLVRAFKFEIYWTLVLVRRRVVSSHAKRSCCMKYIFFAEFIQRLLKKSGRV